MEQSQLTELILTLSPEEKKQVLEFAPLSLFTKGKYKHYVVNLLNVCLFHDWPNPLSKEEIYATVFPGEPFVEGKLEKMMVEAHKLVRSFLLTQHYFRAENEFDQVFDFGEITRVRKLVGRSKSALNRLQKIQETIHFKNSNFFLNQFKLEYAYHDVESLNNQVKGDLNIPNVIHALEAHYYLNRIALLNRFLLQQKVATVEVSEILQHLLASIEIPEKYLTSSPVIKIQYTIYCLLQKVALDPADAKYFFNLLQVNEKSLDGNALQEFYTYLRNICVLILNQHPDRQDMYELLFDLYEDNLKRGFLHYDGKLLPSRYLAITEYAARVNKPYWALEFINKYRYDVISDQNAEDVYRLNLAFYYFAIGDFQQCLDQIPSHSTFVDYQIAGKRLEIKAFYELQSELLTFKVDAFKMFLSRTSKKLLSDVRRQMNLDFVNLLNQMIAAPPGDTKRLERIRGKILEKQHAAERRWLLAKIKVLLKEK